MMFTFWAGILICVRLLVVEDESRLALLLKRGLEEQGYSVDVTGDGAEALWLATESSYDPASNVVDQYVGYLRRKIDRPFGREDLETVRGG